MQRESPRLRRLRTDLRALERLRDESSILDFTAPGVMHGGPPEAYVVRFRGRGFWRADKGQDVLVRETHEVLIQLGAGYPRMMPELSWRSPIFHPNISGSGVVCLGGYGTHWVPSLNLDELCVMLWDMIRYENYDVDSPYNREAALWAKTQKVYPLPIDHRPLRDRVAGLARDCRMPVKPPIATRPRAASDVMFLDDEPIVDAEVVEEDAGGGEDSDILFID
jgi:hypothetical protein